MSCKDQDYRSGIQQSGEGQNNYAPYDSGKPSELDQLRKLCREQHEALVKMFETPLHTEIPGSPGSPLELMRDAIVKYQEIMK